MSEVFGAVMAFVAVVMIGRLDRRNSLSASGADIGMAGATATVLFVLAVTIAYSLFMSGV